MDAQSHKKPPNSKLFWLLWLSTLALTAASFSLILYTGPLAAKAKVFRQTAKGWEALPAPGSGVYGIQIAESGAAWVQTADGLSRFDGASWHLYTASDFGSRIGYFRGHFALDGDEVWGAAYEGVAHFDGRRWQFYSHAVATRHATSIAAAKGQVWVVDRDGNLSHFDGAHWAIRKLDLPGVHWDTSRSAVPKLAVTGDGALWLVFQGVWRCDGASWTRISGPSNQAALLGVNPPSVRVENGERVSRPGGIWIFDRGEVQGIRVDGETAVRYTRHQLGLEDSAEVYEAVARPPVFALATDQGLVRFDGKRWHGEQLPSLGLVSASHLALAPDGSLWGIGYPGVPAVSLLYRAAALACPFLVIAVIVIPIGWAARKFRYQRQAQREAVLHATGALPDDLQGSGSSPWKTACGVVVAIALSIAGYWAIKKYWPAAPLWLLPAIWLGIHVVSTVAGNLKKRKPLPSDPIGPGGPPRYDWSKSFTPIMGGLVVIALVYGGTIARYLHIPWLAAMPGLVFLFGGQFLFHAYDTFRCYLVEREIKCCRYAKALEMVDGPLCWPSTVLCKLIRTDVLFYWGRARDAEPILKELVDTERHANTRMLAFENLGNALLTQGRHDEAKRSFEAAAKLKPRRSKAYIGLAEVRLVQGVEPVQALADAERALELYRDSMLERKAVPERCATIRGVQAWALARLGRSAESQEAIAAGLREMVPQYLPIVAGFHWRAGMAMLVLENTNAAVDHFRKAAEVDPQGYYGGLAAQHLSQHSVWGAVGIAAGRG